MIEIQGVSKAYGQTAALHSIDLTIPAGQTTVFIGQSGCGKSTILRLIIGLIQADSGSVFFKGTKVTPETVISLRRKMGYVIQEGGLFPHLYIDTNRNGRDCSRIANRNCADYTRGVIVWNRYIRYHFLRYFPRPFT